MEDTDFENLPPGFMVKEMSLAEYAKLTEKATTGVLENKQISAPLRSQAKRARVKNNPER